MKCPVCKNKILTNKDNQEINNHTNCNYIKKFKCMCGCDRIYNLNHLNIMGLKPNDKVKCRRKKIKCQACNVDNDILMLCPTFIWYNNINIIYQCPSCIYKSKIKYDGEKTHIDIIRTRLKNIYKQIESANIIMDFYQTNNQCYSSNKILSFIDEGLICLDDLSEKYRDSIDNLNKYHDLLRIKNIYENKITSYSYYSYDRIYKKYNIFESLRIFLLCINRYYHSNKLPKEIIHMIILKILTFDCSKSTRLSPYFIHKYKY